MDIAVGAAFLAVGVALAVAGLGHRRRALALPPAAEGAPAGYSLGTIGLIARAAVVVGVVEHARQVDVHEDSRQQVYRRHDDLLYGTMFYTLRGDRTPWSLAPDVQAAIRRIDPGLPIADLRPMEDVVSDSLRQQRVSAVLIAGFALGAIGLAAAHAETPRQTAPTHVVR